MTKAPSGISSPRPPKVLAVSSGGGHWAELMRLQPAWEGADLTFVATDMGYRPDIPDTAGFCVLPDANKTRKVHLVWLALRAFWLVLRQRPDVVVSTGAAPGYFAIRFGKMLGARTIWIDSIANAEDMSLSGKLAEPYSDLWLTQWAHLARDTRPGFVGAVL